jgi:hypothetical protein
VAKPREYSRDQQRVRLLRCIEKCAFLLFSLALSVIEQAKTLLSKASRTLCRRFSIWLSTRLARFFKPCFKSLMLRELRHIKIPSHSKYYYDLLDCFDKERLITEEKTL